MRIVVDRTLCQGHGVCTGEAPEVFHLKEDGTLEIPIDHPPEALREKVEEAVKYCPTRALSIRPEP